MKIFLSWSGDNSKSIAEIFRTWIPAVIQAVKPYYSPNDIEKGTRWSSDIAKELEASRYGIICLTKENLEAPWIMFEAGALSKNLDRAKVCPFLFGVEPADIKGPLVQFQAARFEKLEVKKLIKSINSELGEAALAPDVLDTVFEMWWPKLEQQIAECLARSTSTKTKHVASRTEKDMLEETLALVRAMSQPRPIETTETSLLKELLQITRSSSKQANATSEFSIWVDSRRYGDSLLEPFEVCINTQESLSDFLDKIWYKIHEECEIPPYTYGEEWLLKSQRTGEVYTEIGSVYIKTKGRTRDRRPVSIMCIEPGDILCVVKVEKK